MRDYFHKNPFWIRSFYPKVTWTGPGNEDNVLYLTFDDGPDPMATDYVLNLLHQYGATATFFCLGRQAESYPEWVHEIERSGHVIGDHGHAHLNGWVHSTTEYLDDVSRSPINSKLFRPPYGRIRRAQIRALQELGYEVVLWSHLSGDFDSNLDIETSLKVLKKAKSGSILVFHDTITALSNIKKILPEILEHFSCLGFRFNALKAQS